ncbi:MAG TPA: NUDIX domain-containing protein [Prolixibacteraceae bacterium]|nr:NUDIX domain-containing protein [Prolixibacteraceae bacterium]
MYKVFFNDRIVFVLSLHQPLIDNNSLCFKINSLEEFENAWKIFMDDSQNRNLTLVISQTQNIKKAFLGFFKIFEAAGGLVFNNENQLLCIKRWGIWDLPKGKIEKDEKKKAAALREVEEETGISDLIIQKKETVTYHIYQSKYHHNKWVLKPTHWYRMNCSSQQLPVPETNEDITEARWLSVQEIKTMVLPNTYHSLLPVFEQLI